MDTERKHQILYASIAIIALLLLGPYLGLRFSGSAKEQTPTKSTVTGTSSAISKSILSPKRKKSEPSELQNIEQLLGK